LDEDEFEDERLGLPKKLAKLGKECRWLIEASAGVSLLKSLSVVSVLEVSVLVKESERLSVC
jgi:hypothetical protein